jgi:Helix-turn-helix domain
MRERGGAAAPRPIMEGMAKTASDFLKVPEAAAAFGVSERPNRNWIHSGQLPAVQPAGPNHAVRVDRRDLLRSERRSEVER